MDWVHWEADFVGIEESEFLLGGVWINSCSPTDMENFLARGNDWQNDWEIPPLISPSHLDSGGAPGGENPPTRNVASDTSFPAFQCNSTLSYERVF